MFQSFLDRPPGKPLDMAQRTLSQSRASKIRKYATDARLADQFYIIPPIVVLADIPEDAEFWFEQYVDEDGGSVLLRPVGVLRLPIETSFSVADGQTRLAAIAAAAQQNANLFEGETLPMMILPDYGTAIKRQIFLDINQHACKPNKSLVSLFDHRDQISDVTREVMFAVKIFADFTALEAVNVSPKSGDLFTLNNLREANKLLLRGVKENQVQVATEYWKAVAKNILVWRQASRSSDRAQIRQGTIAFNAITLNALGIVGNRLHQQDSQAEVIARLKNINFSVDNPEWENLIRFGGRIVKNNDTCRALAEYICTRIQP